MRLLSLIVIIKGQGKQRPPPRRTVGGGRGAWGGGSTPGGSRRNLDWVRPHLETSLSEEELVLLADAQTSGGLLLIGEVPGYPVIGHTTERTGDAYIKA